jgi:5-methylcytosine-specific restriction endonuclease McrA
MTSVAVLPLALSLVREVAPMPFSVDDRFHSHAKVLKICLAARGLWVSAGSWSADHGTDGAVPLHVLLTLGATPELIADLVRAGMWGETAEGAIEFHDWTFWNSPAAPVEAPHEAPPPPFAVPESAARPSCPPRTAGARRVALQRAPALKRSLLARDGDLCRYCARPVSWGKGRAADSGTWDWLEPGGPASPENVVTACMTCAGRKAGRSLKDSAMVLLAPPDPEKRNATCNASDLRISGGNASGNAYKRNGNAYSGETAGQKRYTQAKQDDHLDRSKSSSSGLVSEPAPVLGSRARKAKPRTDEFRRHVIAEFALWTEIVLTDEEADALAAEVLGRAKGRVPSKLNYVLTAIRGESNRVARWLPGRPAPSPTPATPATSRRQAAKPDHCGKCDPADRTFYDEAVNQVTACPDCHPKFFATWSAA